MAFCNPVRNVMHLGLLPGHRVADFGAGAGHHTLEAATYIGTMGRVYAVDIQRELLQRLVNAARAQALENVEIVTGDLEEAGGSGLASASVNAVIAANILFQLEKREALAAEVARVLREGGKALVIDWKDSYNNIGPQADDVVEKSIARSLFEQAGLSLVKEIPAGDHHYGFLFRK